MKNNSTKRIPMFNHPISIDNYMLNEGRYDCQNCPCFAQQDDIKCEPRIGCYYYQEMSELDVELVSIRDAEESVAHHSYFKRCDILAAFGKHEEIRAYNTRKMVGNLRLLSVIWYDEVFHNFSQSTVGWLDIDALEIKEYMQPILLEFDLLEDYGDIDVIQHNFLRGYCKLKGLYLSSRHY